jgi:ppGpp synthetase/RelA/SpoT-type nucleotidyltranferase
MTVRREHGARARLAYERLEYQAYLRAVRDRTTELVEAALHGPLTAQEASVTGRIKDPGSFELKAARARGGDETPRYLRPLSAIHDQVALRVVVLHSGLLTLARDLIQAELVVEDHEDKSFEHSERRSFGYRGIHLSTRPVEVGVPRPDHRECGTLDRVEIQVRTQAQHAWAEVEHRLRYKNRAADEVASRALDQAAALLETADDMLWRLVEAAETRADEPQIAPEHSGRAILEGVPTTLPELLERWFPGARQPTAASLRWIGHCAEALDLGDIAALDKALTVVPFDEIEAVFRKVGHAPRSQVRQLDDALLWVGGERYVEAAEEGVKGTWDRYARGRPGILRWRLDRLREAGVFGEGARTVL